MTGYFCPIATVNAPIEQVWSLLSEPDSYALWWDAQTRAIDPPGPAQPGQVIHAQAKALGKRWGVTITVNAVYASRHLLDLTSRLPLGITVDNHITCTLVDSGATRLAFG